MTPLNLRASAEDAELIDKIAARYAELQRRLLPIGHDPRAQVRAMMDVTVVHLNGVPLRLAEILAADDSNFVHDLAGITRHLDRSSGRLGDCFMPRFFDSTKEKEL